MSSKHIYISEKQLPILQKMQENVEWDEYTIGGEPNSPAGGNYCHVNIDENVSIRGDISTIDVIEFVPYEDEEDDEPHYEIDGYDVNGEMIITGDFYLEELIDTFGEGITHDIVERNARKISPWIWRIDDLLSRNSTPNDINNVEEVNSIAKRMAPGGPSAYLLVDGELIGFYDHAQISCIDGMTPCKFVSLGNIRVGNQGIELIKKPTYAQQMALQRIVQDCPDFYVDIGVDSGYVYPKVVWGRHYMHPSFEMIMNDIDDYFEFGQGNVSESVEENVESEVEASEVDLSSFKKQHTLAPNIWDGDALNSRVRLRLLDIADDFWDYVDVKWVEPKGIILTGSICNYNWSSFSDIDLHLIVDFKEVDERADFVKDYMDAKKNEWNDEHKELKIFGYPIEVYVQDVDDDLEAGGIYDLEEDKWIRKPNITDITAIQLEKYGIKDKAARIMTIIDDMSDALENTDDSHKKEEIGNDAEYLWHKIKSMRQESLDKEGESSKCNIVYKALRRFGYLDKLFDIMSKVYDQVNSIEESKELVREYLDKKYNMPLYQYFYKWEHASDLEKAAALAYDFPKQVKRFIYDQCYSFQEFDVFVMKNDEFIIQDSQAAMQFFQMLNRRNLCGAFIRYIEDNVQYEKLPTWLICDLKGVVKNEWCIHFTDNATSIARNGFNSGTLSMDKFAYTDMRTNMGEGYNFAYPLDEKRVNDALYGQEAVIFQTSGVRIHHYGDDEDQVIFYGPDAKNFIPIVKDDADTWCIYGQNGQVFKRGTPMEIVRWALSNLPQYRKQIMYGKNGKQQRPFRESVIKENTNSLLQQAKEIFGVTYDIRECGWILPDGSMLDFNEKNQGGSGGYRTLDHRAVSEIGVDWEHFRNMGAIRCDASQGMLDIGQDTTPQQDEKIARICKRNDGYVELEVHNGIKEDYVSYEGINYMRLLSDIHKFYQEGLKPSLQYKQIGEMAEYLKLFKGLNEEVVADGNADHNPYAKRWEAERQALKNFLVNYGQVMTSKENGKQYKVYYDKTLSDLIGNNYCICIQWDPVAMKPNSTPYVRALDKFTMRTFQAQLDTSGRKNEGLRNAKV